MKLNGQIKDAAPLIRKFQDIAEDKISEGRERDHWAAFGLSRGSDWEELLESSRILIISEAGVGKSHECRARCNILNARGEPAFFLELASLAGSEVRRLLSPTQRSRLDAWQRSQSEVATFFLDSFDELKITQGSFRQALLNLGNEIESQLDRVRIVVTARPIPFDLQLFRELLPIPDKAETVANAQTFARIAMGDEKKEQQGYFDLKASSKPWRTVELLPLSDDQISDIAKHHEVQDVGAFVADLKRRNAEEFARRPQDLIEMCSDWNQTKRIGSHREQVSENIRIKLLPRDDRKEVAEISGDEALDAASRLALAMVLTRRLTIRHNAASDDIADSVPIDPAQVLTKWKPGKRKALLERALFGFASYGRVRFHHQSVLHYLAARHLLDLRKQGMPFRALRRLLFFERKGKIIVRPFMRATACWLAIDEPQIFEIIRDNEPSVLFDEGDPGSLTIKQRSQVVKAFVEKYRNAGDRGWTAPRVQLHRIASTDLASTIRELWSSGVRSAEVRVFLLDLVASGPVAGCEDLAAAVAFDSKADHLERIYSIDAMAALSDPRLLELCGSIAASPALWPEDLALAAVYRLFPAHMRVAQLSAVLARLSKRRRVADDMAWHLPRLIENSDLSYEQLVELRDALVAIISKGLRWQEEWPEHVSDRKDLCSGLAQTCTLGIARDRSDEWLKASVLASRLHDRNNGREDPQIELRKTLSDLAAPDNERLFWIDDEFLTSFRAVDDTWGRLSRMLFRYGDGPVTLRADRDFGWVKRSLGDQSLKPGDRALMLEALLYLFRSEQGLPATEIMPLIEDSADLTEVFTKYMANAPKESPEKKWERDDAIRKERAAKKHAEDLASWERFWHDIAARPNYVFSPEKGDGAAWDLWRAMSHEGEHGRTEGWNRPFIERHFGKETADRLRSTLCSVWRKYEPTLPSERPETERNTYLVVWQLGLAAIYAEAEDPEWAHKLTSEDARRAARFGMIRLNGLPRWLDDLCREQRAAVEQVLGAELAWELGQNADQRNDDLLQAIHYSSRNAAEVFVPQLAGWLDGGQDLASANEQVPLRAARVRRVVNIILKHGSDADHAHLLAIAKDRVARRLPRQSDGIWLPTLMTLSPEDGVTALEERIRDLPVSKESAAVEWFAALFGDRQDAVSLKRLGFTSSLLLRLVRAAYVHVAIADDEHHEGTFTPGMRDDAERARNAIVSAIFDLKGEEGLAVKMEMADDPLCAHFKDRIIAHAEEHIAQQLDADPMDQAQAAAIDVHYEAAPSNNAAMFELMVDRLSDVEDFLTSDASPRELWAGIRDERVMRRELARTLRENANGTYLVDQEAVTGDEKETDVRLRSAVSNHEAVIELKIGDSRWSAKNLRDTIKQQLLDKYLAPEHRRSGCLLVTVYDDRSWKHPDTGKTIKMGQLESILDDEAKRLQVLLGGEVKLHAKILDLRPPI
ncbi:UNVERIFIED_ORG: hypothetical protein J2W66_003893 [Agrobacterium larrymoorei]|nr:hypothetical protein [Agrobacterium larrymoorei]